MRWQARTFWFALLWLSVTSICAAPLIIVWIGFGLTATWILYRVARGWLALHYSQPLPYSA